MQPKITVVTICYNIVNEIENTILSVINQNYPNIEYIIIDGGSSDGTVDIITKYTKWIDYFSSEPDKGVYDAMNKGIRVATGEWINFMNGGDIFASNDVLSMVFLKDYSEYGVIFGNTIIKSLNKEIFENGINPFEQVPKPLLYSMTFTHQSSFVKTKIAKKYPFDTQYKIVADFDMFHKLFEIGYRFKKVDILISIYDGNGLSSGFSFKKIDEKAKILRVNKSAKFYIYRLCLKSKIMLSECIKYILPSLYTKYIHYRLSLQESSTKSDYKSK